MDTVVSRDGTVIAYERSGEGPAVVLVGGALSSREAAAPLAQRLAGPVAAVSYDRRGRGDSGDTDPYAVAREVEDLAAVVEAVGGSARVLGYSSGAALALEAAAEGVAITHLALYEPPYIVDESRPPVPADYLDRLTELLRAGRRGDAVALFLTEAAAMPVEELDHLRRSPLWDAQEALAHTLPYDATIMAESTRGDTFPPRLFGNVHVRTLVLDGGASPAWMHRAAQAVADALPLGQRRTLEGQTHRVDPEVLAPVLLDFFTADEALGS
ncbi:alpha/beta fold hydrolase [Georgenia thermotolerans]|uniref:Alpha/beta fold hydrolase n=1 Tax=Georgenia thermotolerans TaxID=527326 RepID=A0A7J5UPR7_9MICO|nr:alpha/beta hydrolase [Georgenia thermotolerans]KAE8764221.1 alpha/beta fold hydrolase [Georgenia thermotolerans]